MCKFEKTYYRQFTNSYLVFLTDRLHHPWEFDVDFPGIGWEYLGGIMVR